MFSALRKILKVLIPFVLCCLLAFLIVRHNWFWWWFEVHTGTVHESGPYYGFWSGFGSDIGEYVILSAVFNGLYLHWKHINCHAPGCPRVGRYAAAGGQYKLCHIHHPDHMGEKPTLEFIHRMHHEHLKRIGGANHGEIKGSGSKTA